MPEKTNSNRFREKKIEIGVFGLGEIATNQHIPIINKSQIFELVATISQSRRLPDVPSFSSIENMKQSNVRPDALALCMPPEPRFKFAMDAIREGYHLLLEKPPCLTTDECDLLIETAHELDVTIFASWHSKFGAMVKNAAEWLQKNGCDYFEVNWEEDWEKWHPGQKWISRKGGLGVLDPGINALSILCSLFDQTPTSQNVEFLRPANWETPIAAKFNLSFFPNINGGVNLQWQSTLAEKWEILFVSGKDRMVLSDGGNSLYINDVKVEPFGKVETEYSALYRHFALLVAAKKSDFDSRPIQCVEELFQKATWRSVGAVDIE